MPPWDLEMLRRKIIRLEEARRRGSEGTVSSGCGPLDELLPEGGLRRGTLAEWLAAGEGTGSGTLALLAAREACRDGGTLVVLDGRGEFYPPAAVRLGIALEQLMVVHAGDAADNLWALDQALAMSGRGGRVGLAGETRRSRIPPLATRRRRRGRAGVARSSRGGAIRPLVGRRAGFGGTVAAGIFSTKLPSRVGQAACGFAGIADITLATKHQTPAADPSGSLPRGNGRTQRGRGNRP